MPARSNDFQRLIRTIEEALKPLGATVRESVPLAELGGDEREVDILIEAPVGPRTHRIAVECRAHTRKADLKWIDELAGKYRDLAVDSVVAVSKAGFTPGALRKARILHIQTHNLGAAINADWVDKLAIPASIDVTSTRIVPFHAHYVFTGVLPPGINDRLTALTLRAPDGTTGTILDVFHQEVKNPVTKERLDLAFSANPGQPVDLRIALPGWVAIDADGAALALREAHVRCRKEIATATISLTQTSYGNAVVGHGEAKLPFLTIRAASGGTPDAPGPAGIHLLFEPQDPKAAG